MILANHFAFSQLPNQQFEEKFSVNDSDSARLNFELSGLGFFRNNEYFNTNVEGYTLFGYQLNPRLNFQVNKNISLLAGAFLMKDFGREDFSMVQPTFTLKYSLNKFSMLFGNLEGSLAHRLIEPVYGFENVILRRQESGVQFRYLDKEKLRLDAWVDWERMIVPASNSKERLWGGFSGRARVVGTSRFDLTMVGQVMAYHIGGQIDLSMEPTLTQVEYVPGIDLDIRIGDEGYFRKVKAQSYFAYQRNNSEVSFIPNELGYGFMNNLTLQTRHFDLMVSHWWAYKYNSFIGSNIYQTYSGPIPDTTGQTRFQELVFLRLMKDWQLSESIALTARIEPFYDIRRGQFNYSYGIYLNYRLGFRVLNLQPVYIF